MIVISENLVGIARRFEICPPELVEEFSLRVRLDRVVRRVRSTPDVAGPVTYEVPFDPDLVYEPPMVVRDSLILEPGMSALACSLDAYRMPAGYFGLLQTKGSLARMFVSATANDGQVEPGYHGKITLELTNHATFPVAIRPGASVAQLFIVRCSSDAAKPYAGRYQGADGPTVPIFD